MSEAGGCFAMVSNEDVKSRHITCMLEIQQFLQYENLTLGYILHTCKLIYGQAGYVKMEIEWRILKGNDSGFMLTRTSTWDWKSVVTPIVVTGKLDIANKGSDL